MRMINPKSGHGMNFGFIGGLFMLCLTHPVAVGIGVAAVIALIGAAIYVISHLRWKE
jgi:hypothetical protein